MLSELGANQTKEAPPSNKAPKVSVDSGYATEAVTQKENKPYKDMMDEEWTDAEK